MEIIVEILCMVVIEGGGLRAGSTVRILIVSAYLSHSSLLNYILMFKFINYNMLLTCVRLSTLYIVT